MAKNLIIGGFTNYGINQLKPWVLSINEVCPPNVDKVICVGNASKETTDWLEEQDFIVVPMPQVPQVPIHVLRFIAIYDYLRENWNKYEFVITTDVKDVYFQSNPFEYLEDNLSGEHWKLIAASEGLKYKDESWGNENLLQAYGPYVHALFKDSEIFNVGTVGGTSEYVKDLVFNIFTNGTNRPIPICDQAVFNVLINTQPYVDVTYLCDDWACEAGTVADPSKIDGFRPNLLIGEPKFEKGVVKHKSNKVYPIVHQYDRVPEWKKFVQEKYGQDDETELFTYKS